MKPRFVTPLILLACCAIGQAANLAAVVAEGDTIGTTYLFDGNASAGGGDHDTFGTPESTNLDRTWNLASPGGGGVDVSITGIAFGIPPASNTNGNVITVTITYLGADGVAGGADDVVLGTRDATLVLGAAARYECLFDTPITGNVNGIGSNFRVRLESLEANNGGSTFNMRLKTTTSGVTAASAVKMDVAGTSASNGLVDADGDGLHDPFETNTGIYAGPTNTGTNPAIPDTDNDGLFDGVENNSGTWVSVGKTGTNPVIDDTDADGLLDGVETNTGTFVSVGNTGTNPNNRDHDNDRLNDNYEVTNGLNPFLNADFDGDTFNDGLEVVFYGSNPKLNTSFPGDGIAPAPGSFPATINGGNTSTVGAFDAATAFGSAVLNEAALGGADFDFSGGSTSFALHFANIFPASGSAVSLTGFAWPVTSVTNLSGDILVQFFDPGPSGTTRSIDKATLLGSARGTLTVPATTSIMYWNFAQPVNFTSSGTGLIVKFQSTATLRIKADNNISTGFWRTNDGRSTFGSLRASRISLGGTAIAPEVPEILSITRTGTTTNLVWDLGDATTVTLQRSTTLLPGSFIDVPSRTNTTQTSYSEVSADPNAFFRLATP